MTMDGMMNRFIGCQEGCAQYDRMAEERKRQFEVPKRGADDG